MKLNMIFCLIIACLLTLNVLFILVIRGKNTKYAELMEQNNSNKKTVDILSRYIKSQVGIAKYKEQALKALHGAENDEEMYNVVRDIIATNNAFLRNNSKTES